MSIQKATLKYNRRKQNMKKTLNKICLAILSILLLCGISASCSISTKLTVTYTVGNNQYATQRYDLNQQISLPIDPEIEGKTFVGWYTDKDFTTPYAEGKVTSSFMLFAKFSDPVVYIIVNTDGGTPISMIEVAPGGEYSVPDAEKEGYTFTGYYYFDSNGEKQDFPSSGVLPFDDDIVIIASYSINKYTVTLNDGFSADLIEETVEHGKTYAPKPASRPGYDFVNWYTDEDLSDESLYDASEPIVDDVTLYAKYTPKNYKITIANSVDSQTSVVDVVFDGAYEITAPSKVGYTFVGFTFDGESFDATGTYTMASNIRVIANYTRNFYNVEFKDGETVLATVSVEHGKKLVVPTAELNKVGYTYTLSSEVDSEIVGATVVTVTYSAVKANVTVFGVQQGYTLPNIYYDGEFTLVAPDRGIGYEFLGFTGSDGKTYEAGETYTCDFVELTLTANWQADSYEIHFLDKNVEVKATIEGVVPGTKAYEIDNFPVSDVEKAGYTLVSGWYLADGSVFNMNSEIRSDIYLYAKYTANKYHIIINNDGGLGLTDKEVIYDADYALEAPTKKGYEFTGFVLESDATPVALSGKYQTVGNLRIKATWAEDRETVTFYFGEDVYSSTTVLNGFAVSAPSTQPSKVGHTFKGWYIDQSGKTAYDFNAEVTGTLDLYAYFEANVYNITVHGDSGDYVVQVAYGSIPSINMNLTDDTRDFNGYYTKLNGKYAEEIDFNLPYLLTDHLEVYEWWVDRSAGNETDDLKQNGDYFTEKDAQGNWHTFVYIVGHTYNFSNTILTPNGNEGIATITVNGNNSQLVALSTGEFTVTVTKYDNQGNVKDEYQRTIKVVEKVFTFTYGEDYANAWTNRQAKNWDNNAKGDNMAVGKLNFKPDVKAQTLIDGILVDLSFDKANVEYKVTVDGNLTTAYEILDGAFNFDASLVGKTVVITMAPRYAIYDDCEVTFTVVINEGVNVYTDAELRQWYEDETYTGAINILRNIKVQLPEDRILTAKDVVDINANSQYKHFTAPFKVPDDIVAPKNVQLANGAYERNSGALTINGNYFTIDGSSLPLVDGRLGNYQFGEGKNGGTDYIIQNVQFSIFKYGVETKNGNVDQMKMENLYILGNMNLSTNWGQNDGETYTVEVDGKKVKVLTMSGAAVGVTVKAGTLEMDNVTVRRTVIAVHVSPWTERTELNPVTNSYHSAYLKAKDVIFDSNWANGLYMYGFAKVDLDSSYIGVSSGPCIHIDARPSKITEPELNLTNGTILKNLISGSETWFKVYGFDGLAQQLTGMVNDGVKAATNNALQAFVKDNDLDKINLMLLIKSAGGEENLWDSNGKYSYPTAIVTGMNHLAEVHADAPNHITQDDVTKFISENQDMLVGMGMTSQEQMIEYASQYLGLEFIKANAKSVTFDTTAAGMTGGNLITGYAGVYVA